MLELFNRAQEFTERVAIFDSIGSHKYSKLLQGSSRIASFLLKGKVDLKEARVALFVPPGFDYVVGQWGIWMAGGIVFPLGINHPEPELAHVIQDSQSVCVIAHRDLISKLEFLNQTDVPVYQVGEMFQTVIGDLPDVDPDRRAMIVYTSGTTGKPKGVVSTHRQIEAQVKCLVEAWDWSSQDRILHVLPLHHVHGIINVLTCAMWSGACCEFLISFSAEKTWDRLLQGGITLFMAVPTIYSQLISVWEKASSSLQSEMSVSCSRLRLMVSGSAALPIAVFEQWQEISGHVLLERYGMTEIGMALSNPLHGDRLPGHVGYPLPGVQIRLVDEDGKLIQNARLPGEILVKGPSVFLEYWNLPDLTRKSFKKGWFCTGDIATLEPNGMYRIFGRNSIDIIKTGGYKVSALEIEDCLRTHPEIRDCAVFGITDVEWGERIAVAVVTRNQSSLCLDDLRLWAKDRLAPYKIPTRLRLLEALPRNAMGKPLKPEIKRQFQVFQ